MTLVRGDWTLDEAQGLYDLPLLELVHRAALIHREFHDPGEIQVCQLHSIKTGGCREDCAYCSQSIHNDSGIKPEPLATLDEVMEAARRARANGIVRFCMGAAWPEVRDGAQFERVLEMVRAVAGLGLEVCCTLGKLSAEQARALEAAGLHAYNHNLDTSADYYPSIVTTRTYQDRLDTIANVRSTGVTVCCGGIIGLGETRTDRIRLLQTLATLDPHPESVPINVLSKVPGTPLADQPDVPIYETVRMVATARILMPRSVVRLAAGRHLMSFSDQALCFLAGANSIFSSEHRNMLTTAVPCADHAADRDLLDRMGMRPRMTWRDDVLTAPDERR